MFKLRMILLYAGTHGLAGGRLPLALEVTDVPVVTLSSDRRAENDGGRDDSKGKTTKNTVYLAGR